MSQDLLKIQHALSRLELAKAIKTPESGAIDAEPWSKSIIFHQPFIKQMLQQRDELKRRDVPTGPKLQNRRKSHSSLNLESKISNLSMKRSMTETSIPQPVCLPSDSEEEEEEEEETEDSDSDSDEENDSEPFQAASQQRPVSYTQKPRSTESIQDDISSPSRSSSIICPLTDEEEPISSNHRRMAEQSTHAYSREQYTYNNKPIEMVDPMYYQRMQQYQLQLQYQTQLQYQQAMMQQQQQQLYLRTQTPVVYLPTLPISSSRDKKQAKKRHIRVNSTDLRRRAEMMKNAAEFSTKKPPSYYTLPVLAPPVRTNRNISGFNNHF